MAEVPGSNPGAPIKLGRVRTRWLKIGVAVIVPTLVVAGYLVGRSSRGGGGEPEGHPVIGRRSFTSQAGTIRDALAGAGRVATLSTERCPTQAVGGGYTLPPSKVRVRIPVHSPSRLAAYAATNGILLPAPVGWECTAFIGADGTEEIGAGPIGSVTAKGAGAFPTLRPRGPGVRVTLIPGCEGCIASAICSFFPRSDVVKVYESAQPCKSRPKGELRLRLSRSTFMFVDPAGRGSSSTAADRPLATVGILSYSRAGGVRQLGCTLAVPEIDTCAEVVGAFVTFKQ